MTRLLPALLLSFTPLVLASCSLTEPAPKTSIERFRREALARSMTVQAAKITPISLEGLNFKLGALPGNREFTRDRIARLLENPKASMMLRQDPLTSSILVTDADPNVPDVVEVTVSPLIAGTFIDIPTPTAELIEEQHQAARHALEWNGYPAVRWWKRGAPETEISVSPIPSRR